MELQDLVVGVLVLVLVLVVVVVRVGVAVAGLLHQRGRAALVEEVLVRRLALARRHHRHAQHAHRGQPHSGFLFLKYCVQKLL